MKKLANNLFYNWKTTLLGVAIALLTVFMIKEQVITSDLLIGVVSTIGTFLAGWLGFGARDRMPNFRRKDQHNCKENERDLQQ